MVIYKITNNINNKMYIGQTIRDIDERWYEHCKKSSKKHSLLTRAILKYGKQNFNIEILEKAENLKKLNELEIYYINKYNSLDKKNGYNICLGGSLTKKNEYKKIVCLNDGKIFETMKDASRFYKVHVGSISKICNKKCKSIKGYSFCFLRDWDGKLSKKIVPVNKKKKVLCKNDSKTYSSISEAACFYKIKPSHVSLICNGHRASAKGIQFEFLEKKLIKKANLKSRKIIRINDNKIYKSVSEAYKNTTNISKSGIMLSCKKNKKVNGWQFQYV